MEEARTAGLPVKECQGSDGTNEHEAASSLAQGNPSQPGAIAVPAAAHAAAPDATAANEEEAGVMLRDLEHGYERIKSAHERLMTQEGTGNRVSRQPLARRFIQIGKRIQGFIRSVENRMDPHNVSAETSITDQFFSRPSPASMMSSTSSSPVVPIELAKDKDAMDAARVLSTLWQASNREMVDILPMQILPASIGVQCAEYKPPRDDWPYTKKTRMQCGNPDCATRRHRQELRSHAKMVCSWIENHAPGDIMSQVWVRLEGRPEIKLTGFDIRRRLLWKAPLDLEMADALTCLLRQLEVETLSNRTMLSGRHYVSPQWGANIASGNCSLDTSYNLFVSTTPPFVMKRCTIVLTLACSDDGCLWSCYAFDLTKKTISIMDPNGQHPLDEARVKHHAEVAEGMLPHVVFCMRKATENPGLGSGSWMPRLMLGRGMKIPVNIEFNSGIQAINCMRWYNGDTVCEPPKDGHPAQTRKGLTYQLLQMNTNQATTRALCEAYDLNRKNRKACRKDADP